MEKNKGIFPFRKHPVGELLDGKKERKRKESWLRGTNTRKMHRALGMLLAAALIVGTLPSSGFAVSASEQKKGLCEHHRSHTADCGYMEAQPCTHVHGEECYKTVTECVHTHTDGCYPEVGESTGEGSATPSDAGNREPSLCTHVCSEESGCITKILDCHHEHDESCGYQEAQKCGYVCEICNGTEPGDTRENTEDTGTDTAKCICETLCTEDSINGDCPVCGADDASLLDCKGKVSEENTENQEDTGICKHHQEHDADCGYIPKSEDGEGSPCTYECRICPVEDLIAALPDTVTKRNEFRLDNAEEVRARLDRILALYRELDEDEQEEIDLSRIYALQGALDAANAPMTADGRTEQQDTDEASVTINGETLYYTTLGEAFAAANGKTATITMLNDAECVHSGSNGSPLNINGGNVTLNLNGKTLSGRGYGYYGIIDVNGGSLLVQGEDGKVKVEWSGLSCRGNGKLIVEGITLELVGSDSFFAASGIHNEGGTVILNGTQMTGAANDAQIYHYSGTTTVNNVTATGTTETCPKSVCYSNEGTLTINGGAFDKIAVDSGNYGGVQSVAELLGEGYAYKKQGGIWATDNELAAMEISNVTVKKIPLTINPKGDTSWYYSTQQTHTLEMNAAPAESGNSVSYVWKNGETTLDFSEDAYTVPADTPVGSYTYTCEATCDGYTLSHTFTFKIEQSGTEFTGGIKTYNGSEETTSFSADDTITVKAAPTATGTAPKKAAARLRSDYTAPTEGQMALFVGDVQVSEPVSAGEGGTYTMTVSASEVLLQGNAKPNGNAVTLTAKFVEDDNMADAAGTVDVNISAAAKAERDGTVIGYYGESNLADAFADANYGATVTLLDNITTSTLIYVYTENLTLDLNGKTYTYIGNTAFQISFGSLTIKGSGAITASSFYCLVVDEGTLNIESGSFSAADYAVYVVNDGTLQLTGGSFTGGKNAIKYASGDVKDALANYGVADAPHYAFYQGSSPYTPSGSSLPSGTFTVKECQHTGVEVTNLGDGKHGLTCPYCGYHYEHTTILIATASGNIVTLNGGCGTEGCNYAVELGIVSFTFENLVYGNPDAKVTFTNIPADYILMCQDFQQDDGMTEVSWTLAQLFGNTKVTAGKYKLKVSFFSDAGVYSNECELDFRIDPAPLTADMVTLTGESAAYNGTEQKPALTVKQGETPLTEGTDYEVSYTRDGDVTNDFISAGTVKITVTGKGNYTGTVTKEYAISKADVLAGNLIYTEPADWVYTGQPKTAVVTANNLTGIGEITVKYKKDNSGDLLAEAKEPGTYHVYADISAGQNYNAAQIEMGSFTISYMATPTVLYNGGEKKDWYNRDVDVSADGTGYAVSDTVDGNYKSTYHISAQEGTVAKTLYFMDASGHISEGVDVEVNFDLTPPTGEIAVGAKWWQNALHFLSFGNYAPKAYTVSINAEDAGGSGIDNDKTEYVIVTGSSQYTAVGALTSAVQESEWKEYNSSNRPTVSANTSQYVVYARLTDNAGNVTYISTDGILLDSTAPAVGGLTVPEKTKKDVTAGVTFTVSEAADYYYVVLPWGGDAPSAGDIIVTCGGTLPEGKTGNVIAGTFPKGSGAVSADTPDVSVEVKNLQPNTSYVVYVTAVDRAVDITDSAEGKPAGNIAAVSNAGFTTKKTLPVITKAPLVAGTYGQSVGEMAITGGTAQAGSTVLAGTWAASDADKNEKPSAGTAEVTVIFKPKNANYDSVPVQASLTVSQRNLNAEGVTVSEVAGNYTYTGSEIKPPVAVDTGTPTSGISISDSGAALTANDFTVSYSNNKDAGTASVTITGKGNYTGSVTKTFTIAKASGREVPDLTGSYTDDGQTYTYTVTPTDGAVYRMGDDGAWTAANEFKGIKPGTSVTFYAKMPETGNYEDGMPKSITVNFPKLTPAAPALSYQTDRTDVDDVKVTITPVEGAEYSFDGGTTWKSGEGANVQDGFTTSGTVTLAIRLKETDTHNQSPVQTVTVDLAKKDRGAPPAFKLSMAANGETDYTVTIPSTEGCEYSFDGVTWSGVNVKTGVSVGETVTGYKRYKENDEYNVSSAVSAKETMPKFTVKTPVISPAGGSYSGSVSVTITCGSPDAEIYYTTDGSTPGRSSTRYTGAFTVSAPATVKAVAIKDGLNGSAVATASYTKESGGSGGNGGNSGGNENNGGSGGNDEGQGSGGSTNPGNGNTTPQPFVTQPADTNTNPGNETTPGTGTKPAGPGNGTTAGPGTAPGSDTGTPAQRTKQPFIKGADGKIGWDVIRAEEEKAEEGSVINVDMNGSAVVPGDIFDRLKGKDITITFDMGSGIIWSVDGKSITTDKAGDIDFSVQTGVNTVPVDIVNNVTGERYSIQLSLAYDGEFGFTAVLSIGLGRENAGYTASLYYYNESTGELEFIYSDEVAEDGTVSLAFTHASDYVIAIDGEEESGSATEPEQPGEQDGDSTEPAEENPQTGQAWRPWWLIVAGALMIVMGIGVFFVVKKKQEDD